MSFDFEAQRDREKIRKRNRERMRRYRASYSEEKKAEERDKKNAWRRRKWARMSDEWRRKELDDFAAKRAAYKAKVKKAKEELRIEAEKKRRARIPLVRAENRRAFDADPAGMYARIRRAVPRHCPSDVRDDIAADISIALLDGELELDEIERSVTRFVSAHYRAREWHEAHSLDAIIPGTDNLRLVDTIAADAAHF